MLSFPSIVEALFVTALVTVLVNFRFLMYPLVPILNPVVRAKRFSLRGNTLVISDLHLKLNQSFNYAKELCTFIKTNNI